jgi:hypothetical protein
MDARWGCPVAKVDSVLRPRLVTLTGAAEYLSLSKWTLRDLLAAGLVTPVSIPLPPDRRGRRKEGRLRRLLFDVADLDARVEAWKVSRP